MPAYPITLTAAPTGVTLSGNILTIDYSVVTEGEITLTTGIGAVKLKF